MEERPALDPCNDLYILMCFAAAQVAVGSVQILSCLIGKMKGKSKVGDAEADVEGTSTDDASNGGMTVLGVLSWIAGIIMLTIYTSAETFGTSLPNMTPERFYNSFKAAVILNIVLFAFGLLFIITMTGIFVFTFIFRKGRLGTLFTFIFSVIVMGIAVAFYGCIAFYGWPYVHGDCKEAIQSYTGPSSNNFTFTLDGAMKADFFQDDTSVGKLETDVSTLISNKLIAGPGVYCLVDDDCAQKLALCNENFECESATGTFDTTANITTTAVVTTTAGQNLPVQCVKGRDCGKGKTCNDKQKCVDNEADKCGSKLDCNEQDKPYCEKGSCVAAPSDLVLNAYGNEWGRIFYQTSCNLINDPSRETEKWEFTCEYIYESDAIQSILNQEEDEVAENEEETSYVSDTIECELLDLQFRQFQVDAVKLSVLESEGLSVSNCEPGLSLITTPEPSATEPSATDPSTTTEMQPTGDGVTTTAVTTTTKP